MSENISIKPVPDWNKDGKFNYDDTFLDSEDFENLNKELIKTGISLKNINKKLAYYEKQKAQYDVLYKRKYRQAFLNADTKTESHRKIYAEIECEDLELKIIYLDQMIKEITRASFALRTELEILETIGHNIRREMTL